MNHSTKLRLLSLIVAGVALSLPAFPASSFAAEDEEEGGGSTVDVPKEKPVFSIMLPEGWTAKKPIAGIEPEIWSPETGAIITVKFERLGELDEKSAPNRLKTDAGYEAMGYTDAKITAEPGEWDKEIAGHKAFHVAQTYKDLGDQIIAEEYAFSVDGKIYYGIKFRAPEGKMKESEEIVEKMLASIKAK